MRPSHPAHKILGILNGSKFFERATCCSKKSLTTFHDKTSLYVRLIKPHDANPGGYSWLCITPDDMEGDGYVITLGVCDDVSHPYTDVVCRHTCGSGGLTTMLLKHVGLSARCLPPIPAKISARPKKIRRTRNGGASQ